MKRSLVLALLVGVGALSLALSAQQAPAAGQRAGGAPAPKIVEAVKVKDNLYMLTGGGGNTGVFVTDGGVVVVDTKLPGWGQPILDKIKTISDKPVTMVINTHTHGDHTSGQVEFPGTIEMVAQDNTKTNMQTLDLYKKPENAKFLPKKTFKDKTSVLSGKDQIDLYYFGPGHTNGDAWVVFKALRVVHAGDMFAFKDIPRVDVTFGGSVTEYPQTLAKASAALGKEVDIIMNGHTNTPMAPKDLTEYIEFTKDFNGWVESQIKAGKTVEETIAAYKTPAKYQGYGATPARLKEDVELLYKALKK